MTRCQMIPIYLLASPYKGGRGIGLHVLQTDLESQPAGSPGLVHQGKLLLEGGFPVQPGALGDPGPTWP